MRRILAISLLAACLCVSGLAGEKKGTIGVTMIALTNPFFKVIGDNITAEAAKHGYDVVVVDANFDVARQSNQIKDFIASKYSAVILAPADSKAVGPIIVEANHAGVPVFTVDMACLDPNADIICHVATDNLQGGRVAGEGMIRALNRKGKIGILGQPEAESALMRVQGFKEAISNAGLTKDMPVVIELYGGGAREKGYQSTLDMMQAHPDISGIFAINDPSALGARAALEVVGKADQVQIVAFDGQPEGKEAIKAGLIFGDPIQYPDQMGIRVIENFIKYMDGEDVPREILIPTTFYDKAAADKDPGLK